LKLCGCFRNINNLGAGDTTNKKKKKKRRSTETTIDFDTTCASNAFSPKRDTALMLSPLAMSCSAHIRATASGSATAVITVYLIFTR
jgi:hypothetical protein